MEISEDSSYVRNQWTQRYYYDPGTESQYNSCLKNYLYEYHSALTFVTLPFGFKTHIIRGLSLLVGTDLKFELAETKASGDVLYPQKIDRKTEDGILTVEDIQTNRPEFYRTHQPKEFTKTSDIYLGACYEHTAGINLYVKTEGDILDKNYWTFGMEYHY